MAWGEADRDDRSDTTPSPLPPTPGGDHWGLQSCSALSSGWTEDQGSECLLHLGPQRVPSMKEGRAHSGKSPGLGGKRHLQFHTHTHTGTRKHTEGCSPYAPAPDALEAICGAAINPPQKTTLSPSSSNIYHVTLLPRAAVGEQPGKYAFLTPKELGIQLSSRDPLGICLINQYE